MDAFEKIIGYQKVKEELRRTADMLRHRAKYTVHGIAIPNALLLYGEPGVGKTIMAKALIEESGLVCFACRKDAPGGDFVNKIRDAFAKAEAHSPSIVFLDDMDKFAEDNLQMDCNKEEFSVIQTCLGKVRENAVFTIATANDIDKLPASLMRTGRLGRKIEIRPPSVEDATLIIEGYLSGISCEEGISAETIALILADKSCATIESVINEARILAIYDASPVIKKEHFVRSIMRMRGGLIETLLTDTEKIQKPAYHEAGHALVNYMNGDKVTLVSILHYGDEQGSCTGIHHCSYSLEKIKARMSGMLAGRAAVKLVFDEPDIGSNNDIEKVMKTLCWLLEKDCVDGFEYGYCMDDWYGKQAPHRVERIMDRVYTIAQECYENAYHILSKNEASLHKIAQKLIKDGFILGNELANILL